MIDLEAMKMPADPRDMRKAINEAARCRWDFANDREIMASSSVLIRQILMCAEKAGYSGEDAMTMLAYHALLRYEKVMCQLIDFHNLQVPAHVVSSPAAPPTQPPAKSG